jgi:hypothetical protein
MASTLLTMNGTPSLNSIENTMNPAKQVDCWHEVQGGVFMEFNDEMAFISRGR